VAGRRGHRVHRDNRRREEILDDAAAAEFRVFDSEPAAMFALRREDSPAPRVGRQVSAATPLPIVVSRLERRVKTYRPAIVTRISTGEGIRDDRCRAARLLRIRQIRIKARRVPFRQASSLPRRLRGLLR